MILSETDEKLLLLSIIHRSVVLDAPKKTEYFTPHKEITVAIGKDNTARIILDNDALDELYSIVGVSVLTKDEN